MGVRKGHYWGRMMLNREALQSYQERWKLVAETEQAEWRLKSLEQRWQELNLLFRVAARQPRSQTDEAQTQLVCERWTRLRSLGAGGNKERPLE